MKTAKCNDCKYARRADPWNIRCTIGFGGLHGKNYGGCNRFEPCQEAKNKYKDGYIIRKA